MSIILVCSSHRSLPEGQDFTGTGTALIYETVQGSKESVLRRQAGEAKTVVVGGEKKSRRPDRSI